MKTLQKNVFLLAITIVLSPMIPFWLGDYYEQKMENTQDEDKISQWRNARLFYRQAQIAPWMWLPVEKRKRNIDNHLSQSMYEIILIGESGAFDATQHLDFIQSREDTSSWQEGATEALYRYGDCDDIIENYEDEKNTSHSQKVQQLTMLCAMQLDKQELFDELYSEKIGMDGMAFWASEPKGKYGDLLKARSQPTIKNWNVFDELSASNEFLSVDEFPLWIESYAQLESLIREASQKKENLEAEKTESEAQDGTQNNENVDEQEDIGKIKFASFSKEKLYDFLAATISKETYPNATTVLSDLSSNRYERNEEIERDLSDCMILASALHVPQERIQHFTKDVLASYLAEDFLPSRLETVLMNKCNPQYYYDISISLMDLYEQQKETSKQRALESYILSQWWILTGARSQLGAYNISKAQKWLKLFNSQSLVFEDVDDETANTLKLQQGAYLYLRSLAREFAGDLSGIEKYGRLLKENNNSLSVLRMGKANLLRQQKAETIWILYGEKDLSLPENLKQEHSDLGSIAQRMNGSGNKMVLNGEEIKYGLLERSTDFRVWYANHLNLLLQYPHKNISTLSLLINNARADKDGPSLLKSHFGNKIHLQSILLRQHLIFLFASFKGNNTSESWNNFSTVQKRWEKVPFPQLWKQPEFSVNLDEIVDFQTLLEDL